MLFAPDADPDRFLLCCGVINININMSIIITMLYVNMNMNINIKMNICQVSLMLFTADEEADRYLCCGLIPNSKAAKKDANKWVQVRAHRMQKIMYSTWYTYFLFGQTLKAWNPNDTAGRVSVHNTMQ